MSILQREKRESKFTKIALEQVKYPKRHLKTNNQSLMKTPIGNSQNALTQLMNCIKILKGFVDMPLKMEYKSV